MLQLAFALLLAVLSPSATHAQEQPWEKQTRELNEMLKREAAQRHEYFQQEQERQRQRDCARVSDPDFKQKCLRGEQPPMLTGWDNYEAFVNRQREQARQAKAQEAEHQRQQEVRRNQIQQQQEAQIEQVRRQQEIEQERQKLNEQRRANQAEQERRANEQRQAEEQRRIAEQNQQRPQPQPVQHQQPQYYPPENSGPGFGTFLILLILVGGGGFGAWQYKLWRDHKVQIDLVEHRQKIIADWESLEDFRDALEQLDEQRDEAVIQNWKDKDWDKWVENDVMQNGHEVDTSKLHSQFTRYKLRDMEPELAVAQYDFHRPRHNTQQLLEFYIKQSRLRWEKIKSMERANA